MTGFIDYSITTDETALIQRVFDAIAAAFPGWSANEAHLEVVLTEELVRLIAETRSIAADVPEAIFTAFGEKLVKLVRVPGARATMASTWTALDAVGYTIPAGTVVGFRAAGDELWLFQTQAAVAIAPGGASVTGVVLQARDFGAARNGVPSGSALELVDSLAWVNTIVTTETSEGGADAESDDEYLDRLAEELTLLAPRPILPGDFEILARRTAGVWRARAFDGYNPADATEGNERMVAVAAVDQGGAAISAGVKTALQADLDARREVSFVVSVFDPTFTDVDVTFTATASTGFVPADVETAAEAAVTAYLDPATWAGGSSNPQDPPQWLADDTVRLLQVAAVILAVPGVDHVTVLTMGKNGGAQAAADVVLNGKAPLPNPGVIAGTVT